MFWRSLRLVLGIAVFGALAFTAASDGPEGLVTVGVAEPHQSAEYPTVIYPHSIVPRWDKRFLVERRPG
ncbi:MAG TPA: hypothetical protein VGA40_07260, partial [Candidatus Acidoferrales bacterium]